MRYLRAAPEDPLEARRLVLRVCRARAHDAERAAESRERWAAGAAVVLAIGLTTAVVLFLYPS